MDIKQTFAIIAKAPVEGFSKTRLEASVGAERAQQLYQAFLDDFFDRVKTLKGMDSIHIHATPHDEKTKALFESYLNQLACLTSLTFQSEVSFFERLKEIFSLNSGFIHLTGTDIPDFPFNFLSEVTDFSKIYIGPDRDGGYYYLGANASHKELFSIDPSKGVFDETVAQAKKLGLEVELLPEWSDIDEIEDLKFCLKRSGEEIIPSVHQVYKEISS